MAGLTNACGVICHICDWAQLSRPMTADMLSAPSEAEAAEAVSRAESMKKRLSVIIWAWG